MGQAGLMLELTERDAPFVELHHLLKRSMAGQFSVALVSGPLSSGKTTLLHTFAEYAERRGAAVLSANASRAEQSMFLGVLEQIFQACETCAPCIEEAIVGWMKETSDGLAPDRAGPGGRCSTMSLSRVVCEALRDLARSRPVVILVDDAQFADDASLQCLLHLARRLHSARVLLVLSEAEFLAPIPRDVRSELLRSPSCTRVPVELLSEAGVEAAIAGELLPSAAGHLAGPIHRMSGGNPLLVKALIDDFQSKPDLISGLPAAGSAHRRAVLDLLHRSDSRLVQETAQGIAILGQQASLPLLGRFLGHDLALLAQAVDVLRSTGLVEDCRFRHGAARSAVLSNMSGGERKKLHTQAAHLLHEAGEAASVVARHILASGEQQPWCAATLRIAAEQALAEGRSSVAVRYLRCAHRACGDPAERAGLASMLISAEWRSNPAGAVERYLPELVEAVGAGVLTGDDAVRTFHYLLWDGQLDQALDTLRDMRRNGEAATGHHDGLPELDSAALWLPYFFPGLADEVMGRPAQPPRPSSTVASSLWAPQHQTVAMLEAVLREGHLDEAVQKAEQILLTTHLDDKTLLPVTSALMTMVFGDRLDVAASWCDSLLGATTVEHTPMWRALFMTLKAAVHLRRGELADAAQVTQAALALVAPESWGVVIGLPFSLLIQTATSMGHYEKAATYLTMKMPPAASQTLFGVAYLNARGHYYLAASQFKAALRDFTSVGETLARWRFDSPAVFSWRTSAAHAHLCLGETEQAVALLKEQQSLLGPDQHEAWALTLRAWAATKDARAAVTPLKEAAKRSQHVGNRLGLAQALVGLSHAYKALGEHGHAEVTAARALKLANQCGAGPLKAMLIPMTGGAERPGASPAATQETSTAAVLSAAEKRVAVLAGQGHTNRQIAEKLYVTVSTVEQHMTRIYRKLSVKQRSDLGPALQSAIPAE